MFNQDHQSQENDIEQTVLLCRTGKTLKEVNQELSTAPAEKRIQFALQCFKPRIILSSSFGAQAAVCLHLVTRQWSDIPVVFIDTGYHFPETYQFVDRLSKQLQLNLKIYKSPIPRNEQEQKFGRLWEQGLSGIKRYNFINKVEPMQRALKELNALAWITGLRREQSESRSNLKPLAIQDTVIKVHPIIDWTAKDVHDYLTEYGLPYHPLWYEGYVSIGDVHTTKRISEVKDEREIRFFGLTRECGLHHAICC